MSKHSSKSDQSYGSIAKRTNLVQQIALAVVSLFIAVPLLMPAFESEEVYADPYTTETASQQVSLTFSNPAFVPRDEYKATKSVVVQPSFTVPNRRATSAESSGAIDYAWSAVKARGWDESQFNCLVALWQRESHWNHLATNKRSGAYGIPQALPGSKMASAGSDWKTNPETQINWGLGYVQGRYGTPCGAWQHSEAKGWY